MGQYAARPPARRAYAPEGGAIEGNAEDDALMVIRDAISSFIPNVVCDNLPRTWNYLARMFHELPSRDHEDGRATGLTIGEWGLRNAD